MKKIINTINHRSNINELELPATLRKELKNNYAKLLTFEPAVVEPFDPGTEWYALVEYKLEYGVIYKKRFFELILHNPWIEANFFTIEEELHFITKLYVKFPKNKKKEKKYFYNCPSCIDEESGMLHYNRHFYYRGPSNTLFEILFKDPTI